MARRCKDGEHFDGLTKSCISCGLVCWQPHVLPRCVRYCDSALCLERPGHYFDRLVKKCIKCAEICGRHPAECSQHCSALPPPMTTKSLLAGVTEQAIHTRAPPEPSVSSVQLCSFLAVCVVLLLSSLGLALAVCLRGHKGKKTKSTNDHKQKHVVQPEPEFGFLSNQAEESSEDFPTSSSCPTRQEPSDDSNPIETCVCVHCFPDVRSHNQDNSRQQGGPDSLYQQAVLHTEDPVWNGWNLYNSDQKVQEETG